MAWITHSIDMIPIDLENKLDALLKDTSDQVATIQDAYFSIHGRYWQGARTHSAIPADGAAATPDLNRKPSDQTETWATFGLTLPAQTEAAFSVDVYQARAGHGYGVNADVIVAGVRYRRAVNHGPESWREHHWKPFKKTQM